MGTPVKEIYLKHPSEQFSIGKDKDKLQAGRTGTALSFEWKSLSAPSC